MTIRIGRTYADCRVEKVAEFDSISRATSTEREFERQIETVWNLSTKEVLVISMSPAEALMWRQKLDFVLTVEDGGIDVLF